MSNNENLDIENKEILDKKQKVCFIITPIGEQNSSIRRHIDGVIDSAIIPIVRDEGYEVKVAHREQGQGLITEDVINYICDADIVIANLSNLNPNVMFEVALRYCTDKPIIHICEEGTKLPFDIKDQRTIFYKDDMLGASELKKALKLMISNIDFDGRCKNIITATRQSKVLIDTVFNSGEVTQFDVLLGEIQKVKDVFNKGNIKENLVNKSDLTLKVLKYMYTGTGNFYTGCEELLSVLRQYSTKIVHMEDTPGEHTIEIHFYCYPEDIITIKKSILGLQFIELMYDDLPF